MAPSEGNQEGDVGLACPAETEEDGLGPGLAGNQCRPRRPPGASGVAQHHGQDQARQGEEASKPTAGQPHKVLSHDTPCKMFNTWLGLT
jgi:hypothetical protein